MLAEAIDRLDFMCAFIRLRAAARRCRYFVFCACAWLAGGPLGFAENLLPNGSFDHKEDALHGWITDYAWTGNQHYVGNKDRVSVSQGAARIKPAGDAGAKMECLPIPLERGFRYTCTLDVKGGPYRIYFAGYKWKPGVRPHENPELGELRMIYKSKAVAAKNSSRSREKLELPGVELSPQAKSHLKQVRFLTVYIWMMGEGTVDNVTVAKTPDPKMDF